MVHVCEGAMRYPVGWVKMVTLLYLVGVMRWAAPRWTVDLCISPCELIYVIAMCE